MRWYEGAAKLVEKNRMLFEVAVDTEGWMPSCSTRGVMMYPPPIPSRPAFKGLIDP